MPVLVPFPNTIAFLYVATPSALVVSVDPIIAILALTVSSASNNPIPPAASFAVLPDVVFFVLKLPVISAVPLPDILKLLDSTVKRFPFNDTSSDSIEI